MNVSSFTVAPVMEPFTVADTPDSLSTSSFVPTGQICLAVPDWICICSSCQLLGRSYAPILFPIFMMASVLACIALTIFSPVSSLMRFTLYVFGIILSSCYDSVMCIVTFLVTGSIENDVSPAIWNTF